jgi:DNA-binding transcriptional regulator/RsmH inhibitor MraZ
MTPLDTTHSGTHACCSPDRPRSRSTRSNGSPCLRSFVRGSRRPRSGKPPASWYCVPWPDGSILRLYPGQTFENQASLLDDSLTAGSDAAKIDTSLFGFAEHLEMDKTGRVRLPKWHLDLVEMPSDVMVVGARNRLEVHARAGWQANIKDRFREMAALIEKTTKTCAWGERVVMTFAGHPRTTPRRNTPARASRHGRRCVPGCKRSGGLATAPSVDAARPGTGRRASLLTRTPRSRTTRRASEPRDGWRRRDAPPTRGGAASSCARLADASRVLSGGFDGRAIDAAGLV